MGFRLLAEIPAGATKQGRVFLNSVLKISLKEGKSKMVFDISFSYNNNLSKTAGPFIQGRMRWHQDVRGELYPFIPAHKVLLSFKHVLYTT